jgi:hypothetical protein
MIKTSYIPPPNSKKKIVFKYASIILLSMFAGYLIGLIWV